MKTTKSPTMGRVMHLLDASDKAVICRALREHTGRYSGAHQGLLPFIGIEFVLVALGRAIVNNEPGKNMMARLQYKIREAKPVFKGREIRLHLDDAKVARRFGSHPERGRAMKELPLKKVTAGVRWSLPKQDYEPDTDVMVHPHVSLICVKRGLWRVLVEDKYRLEVERWLIDHCR